ncbi:serine hydrolase [Daejeonella lutea]|uniref:CubicO group peptidase, beta-lactamase class C family n=1 Tax=Daejeonella lutea TaxID=572036 RepID=A0A1T5D171_9SPHI|nr:serine hydrolase [Daejeonella lutea]SKB65478.1 CubicO group peptidase, beta-lactamase class C family [Daejeonella lutea]
MKRLLLLLLLPLCVSAQSTDYSTKFGTIDAYANGLLKQWNIPGMGISIVHKGKLIYSKGYGLRDIEKNLPATETTLFPIASNTKLFTAVIASQLAVEGKLNLDKPVRTYVPAMTFYNEELTAKVTLRDMLSHRTGLPTYDGIWVNAPFPRTEALSKIAYMKPSLGFREGYIYNNMMFMASGLVIESVTGKSWEENVRERIFKPLAMNSSGFAGVGQKPAEHSKSYFDNEQGKLVPRTFSSQSETLGPAGTIYSNMKDMGNWMIALVNGGKFNGKQAIPARAIAETAIPQNLSDKRGRYDELSNSIYALGRIVQTYKGTKIIGHTGSIDGFYSNLTYLPLDSLAIFTVHNSTAAGSLRSVMNLPVIDILLGRDVTDWSGRYRKDYLDGEARSRRQIDSLNASRVMNTAPSHQMAAYIGTFNHPVYGDIQITAENNGLRLMYRSLNAPLNHWHYDQFTTIDDAVGYPDMRVSFLTNDKGNIDKISTRPFGDPVTEFVRVK